MATTIDVIRYLLRLASKDDENEPITPLRLYKLLYYCQGWYLAWYGKPLFQDRIEAWRDGPVVPSIYHREPWGKGRSPIEDDGIPSLLTVGQEKAISQVWSYYGKFSAYGLRDMTHCEMPYKNHFHPDASNRCSEEIPIEELHEYFRGEYIRRTGENPEYEDVGQRPATVMDVGQLKSALGW